MTERLEEIFAKHPQFDQLYALPAKRAAYSDRTAHFMACLAQAAYFKFEGEKGLLGWVEDLMSMRTEMDETKAKALLEKFRNQIQEDSPEGEDTLRSGPP